MNARRLVLIGPGKAGRTLAHLAVTRAAADFELVGIVARTTESATAAQSWFHDHARVDVPATSSTALATNAVPPDWLLGADVWLFAVPDRLLITVAEMLTRALAAHPAPRAASPMAWHCSGSQPSDILAPLRSENVALASVHPLKSMPEPLAAAASFAGTPCCIEGDDSAVAAAREFARALGGEPFTIPATGKPMYHAAAVMACNYLVTLADVATEMLGTLGVAKADALNLLAPLIAGTVDNLRDAGLPNALTGPIERGDVATIETHLAALDAHDKPVANLYRMLGFHTLPIADAKGVSREARAKMRRLFTNLPAPRRPDLPPDPDADAEPDDEG